MIQAISTYLRLQVVENVNRWSTPTSYTVGSTIDETENRNQSKIGGFH